LACPRLTTQAAKLTGSQPELERLPAFTPHEQHEGGWMISPSATAATPKLLEYIGKIMIYGQEHEQIRSAIRRFIEGEINPHVDTWEERGTWPAHEVCKMAGDAGFLGINRPEKYGGMNLDLSYAMIWAEEIGRIPAGGVATGLSITSQMATPGAGRSWFPRPLYRISHTDDCR
jgi:alkylation response protein AidB-like acyl-CoA dehydrogenase